MFKQVTRRWQALDRFTRRGIVFGALALIGIFIEIVILKQSRQFVLFGYGFILIIAISCIFWLNEDAK